jgi:type II secretory pathway pseudopilin PulG
MSGFTYVEALIASVLIAITLVPALEAFSPAVKEGDVHSQFAIQQYRLSAKIEDILADSFSNIETEALALNNAATISALYSDNVGSTDRRLVFLSQYDGDNADNDNDVFTGTDQGLVWIKVSLQGSNKQMQSLISSYGGQ